MIKVHQALHGYADGHRLLTASLRLSASDARALLTMSDISGPNAAIPDEGYLTGYPLTGLGMYALARTWPAYELPRPGSVWTHTLLIDFSDLAMLPNPGGLTALHCRPIEFDIDHYTTPILVDVDSIENVPRGKQIGNSAREIISALYSKPKSAIIVPTCASSANEPAVMAIWGQQWPKLRRSFRFCTLSFGDRSVDNARFDLQFIPPNLQRSIARIPEINFVDPNATQTKIAPWLDHAIEDIEEPNTSMFRAFLKTEGAALNSTREAFRPLAVIHQLITHIEQPNGVSLAVEALNQLFGQRHAITARLMVAKAALTRIAEMQEGAVNFVLDHIEFIDPDFAQEYNYSLAQKIWEISPSKLIDLFQNGDACINIAKSALTLLPTTELIDGIERENEIITTVLRYRPELVVESLFWKIYGIAETPGFQVVTMRPEFRRDAFLAITNANRPDLASTACEKCGYATALQVLAEKLYEPNATINFHREIWIKSAISNPQETADYLASSQYTPMAFIEEISHFTQPNFVRNIIDVDPWFIAIERGLSNKNYKKSLYFDAFILARGLCNYSVNRGNLIVLTFHSVHNALTTDSLPISAWHVLEPWLPRPRLFNTEDNSQRLRKAVLRLCEKSQITAEQFSHLVYDKEIASLFAKDISFWLGEKSYIKTIEKYSK